MSSVMRNSTIAGQSIGASIVFSTLLVFITVCLVGINSYHMGNFLISKLTNEESFILLIWGLGLVATGIAALEIPLGKSIVTSYRLHGLTFDVMVQGLFAVIIAGLAVFAGVNSQLADADRRDTQTASYSVSASSFKNMKASAKISRNSSIARAQLINDKASRNIATLDAKAKYQNRLVAIASQESKHTLKKPVEMFDSGSDEQYATIMIFSVVCSFGALFCSGFSAVYVSPLVALPAFSLKAKADHEWDSRAEDLRMAKHELSPLANKINGFFSMDKVPAKALPQPSISAETNIDSSESTLNRPEPTTTTLGAISNMKKGAGIRTPSPTSAESTQKDYSERHYSEIKEGVISGYIKPTVKPVKDKLTDLNIRFVSDAERQEKAGEILTSLKGEGVIISNPDFGKGGMIVARYIVNSDYSETLSTICPECNIEGRIEPSQIIESKGRAKCQNGHVFVVADNLEKKDSEGIQS